MSDGSRDMRTLAAALAAAGWTATETWRYTLGTWHVSVRRGRSLAVRQGDSMVELLWIGHYNGRGWAEYTVRLATAVATNGLASEESGILLHALGSSARGKRLGWRNYYAALDGADRPMCESLAARGLMVGDGRGYFRVTPEGRRLVAVDLEVAS